MYTYIQTVWMPTVTGRLRAQIGPAAASLGPAPRASSDKAI